MESNPRTVRVHVDTDTQSPNCNLQLNTPRFIYMHVLRATPRAGKKRVFLFPPSETRHLYPGIESQYAQPDDDEEAGERQ